MLSMKERALMAFVIVLVFAVVANFVIPVRTFEVKLVTIPAGDGIFVPEHQPFNISCQGLGDENGKFHSMRWLNTEGHVIPDGVPGVQKDGENALKLLFTDPKVKESGVYKCISGYDNTNTLEKAIRITFYSAKPTFFETFENITAEEGQELILNCSALGNGNISYEWYKFEEKISEDANSSVFVENHGSERSALVFRELSSGDEGVYVCEAKNEHGLSSKMYELIVFPSSDGDNDTVFDSSITVETGNITSDSVNFFINITESARQIEVKYSEKRDTFEHKKKWDYGDDYKVEGLIPGGLYTFQFRTVPSKTKAWSKKFQVILLPDAPDVVLQSLDKGTVKLGWFRMVDDIMRGTIEGYELKYFSIQIEAGNYWIARGCPVTIQIPACFGASYTVTDLQKNTYYEIQLRAQTFTGYGEPYRQKIFIPNY